MLLTNTVIKTGQYSACELPTDQLPATNPDQVFIKCPLFAALHGFSVGDSVATNRKYINVRDANGFDIWVQSIRYNSSYWLSSNEYSTQQVKPE